MKNEEFQQRLREEEARLDRAYNVIHSVLELKGWDVVELERYKPGVVRYRAQRPIRNGVEQRIGFAKDEVFSVWQLPK